MNVWRSVWCGYCIKDLWQILIDEIDDHEFFEFAIENLDELFSYIINGNLNIRVHRDITGLPDGLFGG